MNRKAIYRVVKETWDNPDGSFLGLTFVADFGFEREFLYDEEIVKTFLENPKSKEKSGCTFLRSEVELVSIF